MKNYTPEALSVIGEFFEAVTNVYIEDYENTKVDDVLKDVSYEEFEEIAYDMIVGSDPTLEQIDELHRTYMSYEFFIYKYMRPYARALGIPLEDGLAEILFEGDIYAESCIEELIRDVTEALIDALYDTWDYFSSHDNTEINKAEFTDKISDQTMQSAGESEIIIKDYTRKALRAIGEFFCWVKNVYLYGCENTKAYEALANVSRQDLEKVAYDMTVGIDIRSQIKIYSSDGTYSNYPYLAYRYLHPYMQAFGISEEKGLAHMLANGDHTAESRINELISDVTKKLIDGLYDTWDYFISENYFEEY